MECKRDVRKEDVKAVWNMMGNMKRMLGGNKKQKGDKLY